MPLKNIYSGQIPETTMLGQLMKAKEFELDEHLIFGLGEAFDFQWKKKEQGFKVFGKDEGEDIINRVLANQNLNLTVKMISTLEQLQTVVKPQLDKGNVLGLKIHSEVANRKIEQEYTYLTLLDYEGDNLQALDINDEQILLTCMDLRNELQENNNLYLYLLEGFSRDDFSQENRYLNAIKSCALRYQEYGVREFNRFTDVLKQSDELQQQSMLDELFRAINMDDHFGPLYRKFYMDFLIKVHQQIPMKSLETGIRILSDVLVLWDDVKAQLEKNPLEEINGELTDLLSSIARNELHAMDVLMK